MSEKSISREPVFSHVEPVLAVSDIGETIRYWQDILGFKTNWTWGDPPNIGAVSWQKIFVQFFLHPELAKLSRGNSLWIRVRHINALYQLHQQTGADIVEPLSNKPWGMAQYMIREINGYYLVFADSIEEHVESEATLPPGINIQGRKPTATEYGSLLSSVGWGAELTEAALKLRLDAVIYAAVAEDSSTGQIVGCGLILGDNASFYYVKDLMVHPVWQHKRIGTELMKALTTWINRNAPNGSLSALIANETLEPFYQQFGFAASFAMIKYIHYGK